MTFRLGWVASLVVALCSSATGGCGESGQSGAASLTSPTDSVTAPQPGSQAAGPNAADMLQGNGTPGGQAPSPGGTSQPQPQTDPLNDPQTDPQVGQQTDPQADPQTDPQADPQLPAAGNGGTDDGSWELLVEGDWELSPGAEGYRCVRQTLQEDIYISALEAKAPFGTHHTVLGIGSGTGPDGIRDCSASELAPAMVFGSGVGTDTYSLPEGVGLRLRAGQQLLLNLHLFNATTETLRGSSGTRIQRMAASDVVHVAENILAGTTSLSIPPGSVTQSGRCTMSHDVTLISVFPHMHQLGVHMTATAHSSSAGDVVLHDGPYDFDRQVIEPIEEVQLSAGDRVSIDCQYQNDTDRTVSFGDSSLAEMCFLGLFRYPAADNGEYFICTN